MGLCIDCCNVLFCVAMSFTLLAWGEGTAAAWAAIAALNAATCVAYECQVRILRRRP